MPRTKLSSILAPGFWAEAKEKKPKAKKARAKRPRKKREIKKVRVG